MPGQPDLQRPVSVHRNRQPHDATLLAVNVMAAMNAQEFPTVARQQFTEFFASDLFQTAISRTRCLLVRFAGFNSTDKHASTAS